MRFLRKSVKRKGLYHSDTSRKGRYLPSFCSERSGYQYARHGDREDNAPAGKPHRERHGAYCRLNGCFRQICNDTEHPPRIVSGVSIRQTATPTARNSKAVNMIPTTAIPALSVQRISTAAPTSTNSITSAASQSFPNFPEIRSAARSPLFFLKAHAMLTTASSPDTAIHCFSHASAATRRNDTPRISIAFMLLRIYRPCAYAVRNSRQAVYRPPRVSPQSQPFATKSPGRSPGRTWARAHRYKARFAPAPRS